MRKTLLLGGAVWVALMAVSNTVMAQAAVPRPSVPDSVPVTVVLVDQLVNAQASAVILRRANVDPHDVILLRRSDADGARLTSAVALLMLKRTEQGFVPTEDAKIILGRYKGSRRTG